MTLKLSEALKKLIENPDDLSTLPQIVAQVETLEGSEQDYQQRIADLQNINKQYLAQIPIPGATVEDDEYDDTDATIEDAKEQIIAQLGGK